MKLLATFALLALVFTGTSFAQSAHQVGGWSIYTTSSQLTGNKMVMLQTTAANDHPSPQQTSADKLDILCKDSKVLAIVVEPGLKINKRSISYDGPVPTVRLGFSTPGRLELYENWAVLAGGRNLSPYSQLLQHKLNEAWIGRLSDMPSVMIHLQGREADSPEGSTFDTRELSAALDTVGCKQ